MNVLQTEGTAFLKLVSELTQTQQLCNAVQQHKTPVHMIHTVDGQKALLCDTLRKQTNRTIVILSQSERKAKALYEDLRFFEKNVMYYPAKDLLFYSADVHSNEINQQRFGVVSALLSGDCPIVVASVEAFLDRYPQKEIFLSHLLTIEVGKHYQISELIQQLIHLGYERTELVESQGQFAVRGGILDIFPITSEELVRIEFWDTEIDTIRMVEPTSQRSQYKISKVTLFPMRELVYDADTLQTAITGIQSEYERTRQAFQNSGDTESMERLQEHIGEHLEQLQTQQSFPSVGTFISYFYEHTVSLFSYLSKDTIVMIDEPQRVDQHLQTLQQEYQESMRRRMEQGFLLPTQSMLLFDRSYILHEISSFDVVLLSGVLSQTSEFVPKVTIDCGAVATPSFEKRMDLFCQEILQRKQQQYAVVILAGSASKAKRLAEQLEKENITAIYQENISVQKGSVVVTQGSLSHGFVCDNGMFCVYVTAEIFGGREKRKKRKHRNAGDIIKSFADLHIGDYVVHDDFGIGIFAGLERISFKGVQKEYLKISYRDGDNLFVSVNQLNVLQKYIGSGGAAPKLSKMGGKDWSKAKSKAKKAVKILAQDLVSLYAKRAAVQGYAYPPDTPWQTEFELEFPYEETQDQLAAIEDVKRDMESTKVMDRLICGDVGYGKTEVAIRAAFKAVQEGKQVAYLVPTTILAQQHYHTFVQRMANYPVRIELLSRFRTAKQQKQSLQNLKQGVADIVIGTHRLLSKDVVFHDLGLVIVDEEQRFGVSHKEKLKRMSENVDVLTLTATPIPRTLHMSLSGIRDMSILEEPPQERRPVQTYVMENNQEFIREAIQREWNRQGQVYYLYNRVESIVQEANKIQSLIPYATVAYAHGQMSERELENIIQDFVNGDIDVLVCTTIVETGMDIPNVNTIIIQDADRMGLAQLYQLRGRVGRSNRTAYAYLMYQRNKVLKEEAEKRLQTIHDFTEFGSGFQVAMRDLEIRGAGNLLGAEQHGHMELVGYDLYCRLLEQEVQELQGVTIPQKKETAINLQVNAFLPDTYIQSQEQRMEMYKKIASIHTEEDFLDIQGELIDRYGTPPKSVERLLEIAYDKAQAEELHIVSIQQKDTNVVLKFESPDVVPKSKIQKLMAQDKGRYLFAAGVSPTLTVRLSKLETIKSLHYVKIILQTLKA